MIRLLLSILAAAAWAGEAGVIELAPVAKAQSAALRGAARTRDARELRLAPGVYELSETFAVDLRVRGAGAGRTVLRLSGAGPAVALSGGALQDLAIEVPAGAVGVAATGGSLQDVTVRAAGDAVGVAVSGRVWCDGLVLEGGRPGLRLAGGMLAGGSLAGAVVVEDGLLAVRRLTGGTVQAAAGTLVDLGEAPTGAVSGDGSWRVGGAVSGGIPEGAKPLALAVADPPAVAPAAGPDEVALVEAQAPGEATTISWGKPVQIADWTAAIQAAIDSGKPVVRLPAKKVFAQGVIHVRGAVRRIEGAGFHETYHGSHRLYRLELAIGEGAAPVVELDGLSLAKANVTITHAGKRTLVLRGVRGGDYAGGDGAGDVHAVRCALESFALGRGQRGWLHGGSITNPRGPALVNRGGDLWATALTIDRWTSLLHAEGGRSELLGCQVVAASLRPKEPLVVAAPGAQVAVGFLERPQLSVPYERLACGSDGTVLVPRSAARRTAGAVAPREAPGEAAGDEDERVVSDGPVDDALLTPAAGSVVPLLRLPR